MNLDKVGSYEFMIDAYLSDFKGRATLPMIGGFMLKSATRHADERGFGYSSMTGKKRVWVLSRMAIEIAQYPMNDTVMTIKTWVSDVNKLFTERCFAFQNQDGDNIGYARTVWAAIDLDTRRPTNVLELEGLSDYVNKEELCPIDGLKKILPIKDQLPLYSFDVRYSDIDINGHLNSMKYIEHFIDLFDWDTFKQKQIARFEINYIAEGKYGSKIDLLKHDDDNVSVLEMRIGDTILSTSRVTWK